MCSDLLAYMLAEELVGDEIREVRVMTFALAAASAD